MHGLFVITKYEAISFFSLYLVLPLANNHSPFFSSFFFQLLLRQAQYKFKGTKKLYKKELQRSIPIAPMFAKYLNL
jgi:hypothetical protein